MEHHNALVATRMHAMQEIQHEYTPEPVCPHCGKVMSDAWELHIRGDGGTEEVDCGFCEEPITVTMHVSISYSTEKGEQDAS
jgi:hypothetical protein